MFYAKPEDPAAELPGPTQVNSILDDVAANLGLT